MPCPFRDMSHAALERAVGTVQAVTKGYSGQMALAPARK